MRLGNVLSLALILILLNDSVRSESRFSATYDETTKTFMAEYTWHNIDNELKWIKASETMEKEDFERLKSKKWKFERMLKNYNGDVVTSSTKNCTDESNERNQITFTISSLNCKMPNDTLDLQTLSKQVEKYEFSVTCPFVINKINKTSDSDILGKDLTEVLKKEERSLRLRI